MEEVPVSVSDMSQARAVDHAATAIADLSVAGAGEQPATGNPVDQRIPSAQLPWTWLIAVSIILTCALSLVWSHYKLMRVDEFMEMQTDSVPSLRQVIDIQRHFPISLDPLGYHVAAHFSMRLFGRSAFALRLPALLGYLLMQACLGLFVSRIAGRRAAIFAIAFSAGAATLYYSADGRPYGLLCGLCGLNLVAWQSVARQDPHRRIGLFVLSASLALALNLHYYAILLLGPLVIAELARSMERRRLDLGVIASIFAGTLGIGLVIPFAKAASEFKAHYYDLSRVGHQAVVNAYRVLLLDETTFSTRAQHLYTIFGLALSALLIWTCVRILRNPPPSLPRHEMLFAMGLAALPVFGFLLARLVTHTLEPRFVIEAIVGVSALTAIGLDAALGKKPSSKSVVFLMACVLVLPNVLVVYQVAQKNRISLASPGYSIPASVEAEVMASPSQLLYTPDVALFDQVTAYDPDPWMRSHMALVYSGNRELRFDHHDTSMLTERHLQQFTDYKIFDFDSFSGQPGEHVFLCDSSDWVWIHAALTEPYTTSQQVGPLTPKYEFLSVHFDAPVTGSKPSK
jgi:hypothetical protein